MNTKFPGLTATLAIAVISFGYAIMPVQASPPPHSHGGGGGGGDPATTFSVAMLQGGLPNNAEGMVLSDGDCGTTADTGQGELDVRFPDLCVTVIGVNVIPPNGAPLTLRAFSLLVRANKSDVLIFFTDGRVDGATNTGASCREPRGCPI